MLSRRCNAASYEHALVNKLAQALGDSQHRFIIVDAPLLYAAGVQSVCAVAKVCLYKLTCCICQLARKTGKAFQKGATFPHSEVG